MTNKQICPRCKSELEGVPALSRKDNQTHICSNCGVSEAVEDFTGTKFFWGPPYWKVKTSMTDLEKITSVLVTILEAAVVGKLHFERAEAIHEELLKRISTQDDEVLALITDRLTEIVNKK